VSIPDEIVNKGRVESMTAARENGRDARGLSLLEEPERPCKLVSHGGLVSMKQCKWRQMTRIPIKISNSIGMYQRTVLASHNVRKEKAFPRNLDRTEYQGEGTDISTWEEQNRAFFAGSIEVILNPTLSLLILHSLNCRVDFAKRVRSNLIGQAAPWRRFHDKQMLAVE
jgi:hypothetical protein